MAILLGIVENVDDDGVYVTMPDARGVLRGPYPSLATVEAGDTVLAVTTADGDTVVVGRSNKYGQIDQTKVYTSGSYQYVEVQGYNLRIQSNGSAAYFQVAYGGGFTFSGAKVTVPASLGVELGASGPTVTAGAGVPSSTPPDGSLYLRTDGGAGSTLYVRESGSWAAK